MLEVRAEFVKICAHMTESLVFNVSNTTDYLYITPRTFIWNSAKSNFHMLNMDCGVCHNRGNLAL